MQAMCVLWRGSHLWKFKFPYALYMLHVPMIKLTQTLNAWNTPAFNDVLKEEIEQLAAADLPLQQGLSQSSYVSGADFQVMIIGVFNTPENICVKTGIFYKGIIAGCSCADDPTPIDEQTEYCVVQFDINTETAKTAVRLLHE